MKRCLCFFLLLLPQLLFPTFHPSDCFLVLLVSARHLDYSKADSLFRTMAKHPSDGSKNGDVGHAWIYVCGKINGELIYIEGGHSGEMGQIRPKYFEGVMNYYEYGYFDPSREEMKNPRFEPNPVKYLWTSPNDGFFQEGCGGHVPSCAVRVDLTEEQFLSIVEFINPANYNYKDYAITRNQCSSFAVQVAALGGLYLEDKVTMKIGPAIRIFGEEIRLWSDLQYSTITFSSPDRLEASMQKAVLEGRAQSATKWYKETYPKTNEQLLKEWQDSFSKLPERWSRAFIFR